MNSGHVLGLRARASDTGTEATKPTTLRYITNATSRVLDRCKTRVVNYKKGTVHILSICSRAPFATFWPSIERFEPSTRRTSCNEISLQAPEASPPLLLLVSSNPSIRQL